MRIGCESQFADVGRAVVQTGRAMHEDVPDVGESEVRVAWLSR